MTNGLNHWWRKYQNIKEMLSIYMKKYNHKTVEDAIYSLMIEKGCE